MNDIKTFGADYFISNFAKLIFLGYSTLFHEMLDKIPAVRHQRHCEESLLNGEQIVKADRNQIDIVR